MINAKLSFFVDIANEDNLLNKIKVFFSSIYDIDDTFIFTKDLLSSFVHKNFATLPLYYFKFYSGIVVFFTLEDYLEYKDDGMHISAYLYIDNNTIKDMDSVNRNMLKDIQMIGFDPNNNCIEPIKMSSI